MRIYVDMDGVLTDFIKQLAELLNKPLDRGWDFGNDPKIWKKIDDAGKDFWAKMPWMPGGQDLWDELKKHSPSILTSPSEHDSSIEGKKEWLRDNLGNVPYIIEEKKEKYAEPDAILIDDREKNINKWKDAGGIAIQHKDAEDTLKQIKKILSKKRDKEAMLQSAQIIASLDKISEKLEKKGFIKQAYIVDMISDDLEKAAVDSDTMEQFLKSPMMRGYQPKTLEQEQFLKKGPITRTQQRGKTLWVTGDPRLKLVKKLLIDLKKPEATKILSIIEEAEKVELTEEQKLKKLKSDAMDSALAIGGNLGEVIGLLFQYVPGNVEYHDNLNKIKYLVSKIEPQQRPPSDFPGKVQERYRSRMRDLKQLYRDRGVSDLSPTQKKAVFACIKMIERSFENWVHK